MKLRHLVYAYIGTFPAIIMCDLINLPMGHPLGETIMLTNSILLPVIVIWGAVEAIKYFIRYAVKYQNSYKETSQIEKELDEIEATLDQVHTAQKPGGNVNLIWEAPPKEP